MNKRLSLTVSPALKENGESGLYNFYILGKLS